MSEKFMLGSNSSSSTFIVDWGGRPDDVGAACSVRPELSGRMRGGKGGDGGGGARRGGRGG
ncbi:MAG TPA: hypothetical protein VNO21_07370, partial [Polyangiaceae bacterium]|nr:hypothetical protein [Polyangiaceae bacterium]